jgi:hypothetical protein
MFVQGALFAHIRQTLFNVETIDRRAISHRMSLEGHKRTFARSERKSGLPPKPDIKLSDQTSASRSARHHRS